MSEQETIKIPKFRSSARLVEWIKKNLHSKRLNENLEQVFFKCKDKRPVIVASHVAEYASFVGVLDESLEELLKADLQSLLKYLKIVLNREGEINPDLVQALRGKSSFLFGWAQFTNKRLEKELEDSLDDGTSDCTRFCFRYAKEVLKGRLPEHLEQVFSKYDDSYHLNKYAFDVIRGFSPCRLPDELHTYMVMKSFQEPDNIHIRTYMEAAESNPDNIGNAVRKV